MPFEHGMAILSDRYGKGRFWSLCGTRTSPKHRCAQGYAYSFVKGIRIRLGTRDLQSDGRRFSTTMCRSRMPVKARSYPEKFVKALPMPGNAAHAINIERVASLTTPPSLPAGNKQLSLDLLKPIHGRLTISSKTNVRQCFCCLYRCRTTERPGTAPQA
jgi:hypothetical protein